MAFMSWNIAQDRNLAAQFWNEIWRKNLFSSIACSLNDNVKSMEEIFLRLNNRSLRTEIFNLDTQFMVMNYVCDRENSDTCLQNLQKPG